MLLNEKEIRGMCEDKTIGVAGARSHILEGLRKGDISPREISIRGAFANLVTERATGKVVGRDILSDLDAGRTIQEDLATVVDTSNFSSINGQIFYNALLMGYRKASFTVMNLFGKVPSNNLNVEEKFAGISDAGDAAKYVAENAEIPLAGLSEDYINSQVQRKAAFRLPVSREAFLADKTGMLVDRATEVGSDLGVRDEIEACDAIINANGATRRDFNATNQSVPYIWKGSPYAVWQTSNAALPSYDNVVASNPLSTHLNINAAFTTLAAIVNPLTGLPIADQNKYTLLVTSDNLFAAQRILSSMQLRVGTGAGTDPMVVSNGNVVNFNIVYSKYLRARLAAAGQATTHWYFGDFETAYKWVGAVIEPDVQAALPLSGTMFNTDTVMMYRAVRIKTPAVFQPRVVTKNTVS